eukprot:9499874-Pyramimonas_sp.AAC.1
MGNYGNRGGKTNTQNIWEDVGNPGTCVCLFVCSPRPITPPFPGFRLLGLPGRPSPPRLSSPRNAGQNAPPGGLRGLAVLVPSGFPEYDDHD